LKYNEFELICVTPRIFQRVRQSLFRCTTSCIESQGGCFEHFNNLHEAVTWRPDGHVHETFFFLYCVDSTSVALTAFFDHPLYYDSPGLGFPLYSSDGLLLSDIDVVHFAVLQLAMEHIICIYLLTSVVLLSVSSHFTLNGCQANHDHTMKQVMVIYQLDQRQCSEHKQTNQ
jgi:hypothetical protein